nr:MAG TPA: hypothetical protein [Caudoviricetes sp.]
MQTTVNLYPSVGLPGQEVAVHTAIYTPFNYISDGTVAAGSFAFVGTNADEGGGVVYPLASAKGTGTAIGLVERTFTGMLDVDEDGTLIYPKGSAVTIAVRGDYYVAATGAATVGQSVICTASTGAVTYGTAGSTGDTGWVVMTEAKAAGDIIIISNRGVGVTPASGD